MIREPPGEVARREVDGSIGALHRISRQQSVQSPDTLQIEPRRVQARVPGQEPP